MIKAYDHIRKAKCLVSYIQLWRGRRPLVKTLWVEEWRGRLPPDTPYHLSAGRSR